MSEKAAARKATSQCFPVVAAWNPARARAFT